MTAENMRALATSAIFVAAKGRSLGADISVCNDDLRDGDERISNVVKLR
jgi:hypothetical protein